MNEADTIVNIDLSAIAVAALAVILIVANEFHLYRVRKLNRSMVDLAETVLEEIRRSDGHRASAMQKLENIQRQFDIVRGGPHG